MLTLLPTLLLLLTTPTTPDLLSPNTTGLPGGVYICSLPRFAGTCHWYHPAQASSCTTTNGSVASLGPDDGGACAAFRGMSCEGNTRVYNNVSRDEGLRGIWTFPGFDGLVEVEVRSFVCWGCGEDGRCVREG
ncbi:hypothetical protein K458DRAFT_394964 [Lentithecium fluviatile CBS 122367]|uniref:Uncharacterized protein n=1 Tax=Lentithecium fluviatile CBS 122367 TaxID=1168545 RepID=A0A6G1IKA7_9PLEO|nr:hypothetical protein K458DRAFT_394964 [Lentithecium fluviatile CBS 122367]